MRSFGFGCMAATVLWIGCGSGDGSVQPDAGRDAGEIDAAMDAGPADGGRDAGGPDAGPSATGCELLDSGADGASPPAPGLPDAAVPDGGARRLGPGGPTASFTEDELETACAYLDGGETDRDHHNTVLMGGGYLWMPWAHEAGGGGISVFELAAPCEPVHVHTATHEDMRETHAAGFAFIDGRRWMATASLTGIQLWDVTDVNDLRMVTDMTLPDVTYPDSYARVVMSTFWQAPYLYVGASDNGVFVVDASDPESPELVTQYKPEPEFRVGGVHAIGTMLVVFPSEGNRTTLLDIGDPAEPRPIPGGTFLTRDGPPGDRPPPLVLPAYFSHLSGNRTYHARHVLGGGLVIYDISDPQAPAFLGSYEGPEGANGGYVFLKEDKAFVGLSGFAEVIDVSDPTAPTRVAHLDMPGDFDTLVPIGNVVVGSVDDDAVPGQASAVFPFEAEPDARAPRVNMVVPEDGAEDVPLSARVGLTFDEFVEMHTVGPETLILRPEGGEPVAGWYSGQEGAVSLWPARPLEPSTTYEVVVVADGIEDYSGNATAERFRSTFTTVGCD